MLVTRQKANRFLRTAAEVVFVGALVGIGGQSYQQTGCISASVDTVKEFALSVERKGEQEMNDIKNGSFKESDWFIVGTSLIFFAGLAETVSVLAKGRMNWQKRINTEEGPY